MNKLKRIFTAGLMMITVLTMCAFVAPEVKAAASAGDLIKMDGLSSVYYLGADGKRYVFPNESTYFSWYSDFSGVVTIPQSELESYPLGANVTVRPGTKMIKITTNPKVYAVVADGQLKAIPDEATATALYGANWNKRIVDIADSFFTNYTILSGNVSSSAYPEGSLIKTADGSSIYYIDADGKARMVTTESAFLANRFKWSDVITVAAGFVMPAAGEDITGAINTVVDTSQGGGSGTGITPGAGTGLTVALASDTPAAGSVPQGASVQFLKFNLTAANDGDVTVNSVKLTSGGLGDGTDVDSVTMYNDGQRIGNVKNIDSNNEAIFNFSSPIVVQAGATESVVVKASVADNAQYNLGIKAASDVVTNGAVVSGSFPVTGNTMSGVDNVSIGTLTIAGDGTPAAVDLGDTNAVLAKFKFTNDNEEDINFNAITFKRSAGDAADDDFDNFKLYHEGTLVASAAAGLVNKYVTFNLDSTLSIEKGKTEKFTVQADVIDGAGKTITLDLDNIADIDAEGDYYGTASAITDSFTGVSVSINAGTVALAKVNASKDKVRADQDNVVFGTFKVTANSGANIEMTTLKLTMDTVNEGQEPTYIENVEVLINGAVYEMTLLSTSSDRFVFSNADMGVIMANGATYDIVVRADIDAAATNQKYTVKIVDASAGDIYLQETENETQVDDITPNSATLKQIQVENPAITLSKGVLSSTYPAVVGSDNVEAAIIKIEANDSDDLKITEMKFADRSSDTMSSAIISNLKLYKGTTLLKEVSGSDLATVAGNEEIVFSNLSETVSAGEVNTYTLKVSFGSDDAYNGSSTRWMLSGYSVEDATEGDGVYDATAENVSANGVIASGETGYTSMLSGRTITLVGTGSLYVDMDNSNSETNRDTYVIGGSKSGFLAAIKLRADNEDVVIEDLVVETAYATPEKMIDTLYLIGSDKTTVLKTVSNISASTTFENIDYTVGQNSQTVYLKADFNTIGEYMAGVTDASSTFRVTGVVAEGVSSGNSLSQATVGCGTSGDICYDNTAAAVQTANSKAVGAVGIKASNVELVSTAEGVSLDSSLTTGWNKAAIIKVTVDDNGDNSLLSGEEMKLVLSQVKVKVESNSETTLASTGARIKRLGSGFSGVSSSTADTLTAGTDYVRFNLGQTEYLYDDEISAGDVAYFLVEINVSAVTSTTDWIRVSLDALNGVDGDADATGANFSWKDGSDSVTNLKYPLRLTKSSIDGTKIEEAN